MNIRTAKQSAVLVGCGDETFNKGLEMLQEVAYKVSLSFGEGSVTPWIPEQGGDGPTVDASCRYFTTGSKIPDNAKVAFGRKVDPAGVLTRMLSKEIAHCIDNEVNYLDLKDNK